MIDSNDGPLKTYDFIIVGAGPVGCVLALQLQAQGFHVLILEKNSWDICNTPYLNGVSEYYFPLFDRLDILDFILQTKCNNGDKISITTPRGISLEESLIERKRIFFRRKEFDQLLRTEIQNRAIDILDETRSILPIKEGNKVIGIQCVSKNKPLKFISKLVIGCDGAHSKIAKSVGLPSSKRRFHHLYQGRLYKNTLFSNNETLLFPNPKYGQLLLIFSSNGCGRIAWDQPLASPTFSHAAGRHSVGRHSASSTEGEVYIEIETDLNHLARHSDHTPMKNYKEYLEKSFSQVLAQYPQVSEALRNATPLEDWKIMTTRGHYRSDLSKPGVILMGDAACCVDPIGSSGVLLGLQGVEDFLSVVTQSENNWEFTQWERAYLQRVHDLNRFIKLIRFMLKTPMLLNIIFKILDQRPKHKKKFMDVFNGVTSYSEFLKLSFQLKFWLSAIRS